MKQASAPGEYAGFVSRACAFVIDVIIIAALVLLSGALVHALFAFFTLDHVLARAATRNDVVQAAEAIIRDIAVAALILSYPILFWMVAGQTPGKALLGLRVVRLDQRKITFGCAARRCVGYWISALPLMLGFAWVLVDERRQGWHDKLADTCVVYQRLSVHTGHVTMMPR
jgi:uncharacterized RDD family membrane protein YckC